MSKFPWPRRREPRTPKTRPTPRPAPTIDEAALAGLVDYLADGPVVLMPDCTRCEWETTSDGLYSVLVNPCEAHR